MLKCYVDVASDGFKSMVCTYIETQCMRSNDGFKWTQVLECSTSNSCIVI